MAADGRVVASVTAPTTYYLGDDAGPGLVERVLRGGVDELCRLAGIAPAGIAYGFVGLPGYGEVSGDTATLDAAPRAVLGHDRYACGNDMVAGWAGSLGGVDGINIVCGTGSICYGERAGERVRVGGWGELFGDEGSGYWIAVRGLQAFTKMSDGRLPAGPLLDGLRARLPLATDLDLIDIVLDRWGSDRGKVAALSRAVGEAAQAGDAVARGILVEAAAELVSLVETTRRRLGFAAPETVLVSYSGGVFSAPVVRDEFTALLARTDARYELREPLYPPVIGAALYAAKLAGTPLTPAALARLRSESLTVP